MIGSDTEETGGDTFDTWVRSARSRFSDVSVDDLTRYVSAQPEVDGPVKIDNVRMLTDGAGMSNGIAFFSVDLNMGRGKERQELVLRYDPGVTLIKQKSYIDEYLTLKAVFKSGLPVPEARWLDASGETLGRIGFTMDRVNGEPPAMAMLAKGPLASASPAERKSMMLAAAGMMGRLKRMAIGADAVPHLLERGRGTGDIHRELNWWLDEARLNAAENDPHFGAVAKLHDWLVSNQPAVRPASLTHGDGQIANMMFKDGQIVAWLDWELAYLGHQESDLMMVIMMSEMTNPGDEIEGVPSEEEYVARFEAESGAPVEHFPYFKLLMIFKYLVGLLFSKELMQDFEQRWRAIEAYRDKVLPLAEADARSGR